MKIQSYFNEFAINILLNNVYYNTHINNKHNEIATY